MSGGVGMGFKFLIHYVNNLIEQTRWKSKNRVANGAGTRSSLELLLG